MASPLSGFWVPGLGSGPNVFGCRATECGYVCGEVLELLGQLLSHCLRVCVRPYLTLQI